MILALLDLPDYFVFNLCLFYTRWFHFIFIIHVNKKYAHSWGVRIFLLFLLFFTTAYVNALQVKFKGKFVIFPHVPSYIWTQIRHIFVRANTKIFSKRCTYSYIMKNPQIYQKMLHKNGYYTINLVELCGYICKQTQTMLWTEINNVLIVVARLSYVLFLFNYDFCCEH